MAESRFPNADEIAALRARGEVALSALSCRLGAGLAMIFFLLNTDIIIRFKELLLVTDLHDNTLFVAVSALLQTLLAAIVLYLSVFAVIALFQSRFYFRIGQVFKRRSAFFDLGRGFSFIKISSLVTALGILALMLFGMLAWQQFFFSILGQIDAASLSSVAKVLKSITLKLVYISCAAFICVLILAFVYTKISFLLRHRVAVKRG